LKGCPKIVNGSFDCSGNFLESLQFGPKYVKKQYKIVKFKRSRIEVKRTYFAVQDRLAEDVRGRMYDKVATCDCIQLTQREEAIIAMRLN
jgi:hypothetical protein